ncbi:MAG: hypothetical protein V4658_09710, partial [Bacteroidota bacterium]
MRNSFVALFGLALLFSSCLKETIDDINSIKGVKIEPTLSLPLINSAIGMDKLVNDAASGGFTIETDPTKRLVLKFSGKDSLPPRQFIDLPPVAVDTEFVMPPALIPIFLSTGSFSTNLTVDKQITTSNNERIERILVKTGQLRTSITSRFEHNVTILITYPGIKKNGVALTDSYEFLYTGSVETITHPIDLAGYEIDFTKNGTTYNVVSYNIKVDMTRIPGNGVSATTDKIIIDGALDLNEYSRADGYFGKFEVIKYLESQRLSLFDKKLDGNVFIKEPVVRIAVDNSIGMPIVGKFIEMYVESGSGNKIPITIDQFKDTFSLNYTTVTGQSRITEYVIDKNNSNIEDILSSAPQKVFYTVTFTANSNEQITENVVTDKSTIKIVSALELPLDLRILYYAMQETGSFSLSNTTGNIDTNEVNIHWAEISTDVVNYLPLNAYIQVYFEDTVKGVVLDSLFEHELPVSAAKIDAAGTV